MAKKHFILFTAVLVFFLNFKAAHAGVLINEIMYDLDGGDIDWVEVYNPDSTDVDLTTLKLLISNSTSNHSINSSSGGAVLHSGEYGVIVASSQLSLFNTKWTSVPKVFTSSYSLPNAGGKVEINDGDKLNPMSTLTYDSAHGGAGNGKSLQKISGTWQESLPTPGAVNVLSNSSGDDEHTQGGNQNSNNENTNTNQNTNSGATSSGASSTSSSITETAEIQTQISNKSIIFANLSTPFVGSVIGPDGDSLFYGRYVWNFGDGDSEEIKVREGNKISHTYFYPGEYTVTLEYYVNDYGDTPDAMDSVEIKVLSADVLISKVGDEKDFFIELTNNTESPADISKWMLISGVKKFTFPKNTVISSKKKITFSSFVTGFTVGDKYNLKLLNQDGKTGFDYGLSITTPPVVPIAPTVPVAPIKKVALKSTSPTKVPKQESRSASPTVTTLETGEYDFSKLATSSATIEAEDLAALALLSDAGMGSNSYKYFIPVGLIAIASSAGVYFLRRKKSINSEVGEDFEILDE